MDCVFPRAGSRVELSGRMLDQSLRSPLVVPGGPSVPCGAPFVAWVSTGLGLARIVRGAKLAPE
jgi:hypothetical protein